MILYSLTTIEATLLLCRKNLEVISDVCSAVQQPDFDGMSVILAKERFSLLFTEFEYEDKGAYLRVLIELEKFWREKEERFTALYNQRINRTVFTGEG